MRIKALAQAVASCEASENARDEASAIVFMNSGKQITVDRKQRSPSKYRDCLVETWSVWLGDGNLGNKRGWAFDVNKTTDWILYEIPEFNGAAAESHWINYDLLRATCFAHEQLWAAYEPRPAQNNGYVTRNLGIPWAVLWEAMQKQSLLLSGETNDNR